MSFSGPPSLLLNGHLGACFPRDKAAEAWNRPLNNHLIPRSRRSGDMHPLSHMPSWRPQGQFRFCLSSTSYTELIIQREQLIVIHPVSKFPDLIKQKYWIKWARAYQTCQGRNCSVWMGQRAWGAGDVIVDERVCLTARPEGIWGAELYLHSFLTWTLKWDKWSALNPRRFTLGKTSYLHWVRDCWSLVEG